MGDEQKPAAQAANSAKGWATLWLIGLIVFAVVVAAVIFSASQFQGRLAGLTLHGGPLSAWKADQLREEWAASLVILKARRESLENQQKRLATAYEQRDKAQQKFEETNNLAFKLQAALRQKLMQYFNKMDDGQKAILQSELPLSKFIEDVGPVVGAMPTNDKELASTYEALKAGYLAMTETNYVYNASRMKVDGAKDDVAVAEAELTAAKQRAQLNLDPSDTTNSSTDQQVQIQNAVYEFQTMFQHFWFVYYFALAPSDILVLLLILFMGILGSAMQVSYVLLNEPDGKTFVFYAFRPFLGLIMAFVVYIVTKAGIPLVTDTSRTPTASINPYFISFLGIISGLLSERALEWVRQLGTNYFRDTETTQRPRWAIEDLKPKFTALNRDPKPVQAALGASDGDFKDWLEGGKPVPDLAQKAIAGTLGERVRRIFTEIPPP